jgi:hypothetical protein
MEEQAILVVGGASTLQAIRSEEGSGKKGSGAMMVSAGSGPGIPHTY